MFGSISVLLESATGLVRSRPQAYSPQTMSTLASELSGLGHPCAGEENAESASGAGVEQQDRGDDKDGHEERKGAGTLQEAVRPCQSAGIMAGKV